VRQARHAGRTIHSQIDVGGRAYGDDLWMDAAAASETSVIQAFSRFAETSPPVDETVENLCCIWGERWKTTRM
jgi:hypothetical protein